MKRAMSAKVGPYGSTAGLAKEDEEWLENVLAAFKKIAGEDMMISYEEFKKALPGKEEYFAKQYFDYFDADKSGTICIDEFKESVLTLAKMDDLGKLQFLFNLFDSDKSGEVCKEELSIILSACLGESNLSSSENLLEKLVDAVMESADENNDGTLSFEELKSQFEKYPDILKNLEISPSNWLRLNKPPKQESVCKRLHKTVRSKMKWKYFKNRAALIVFNLFLLLVNIGLFVYAAYKHRHSNYFVIFARGCGMALNFDCAFILVYMLRRTLTSMRNTIIGKFLPIDDSIDLHKYMGYAITILGLVHTVMHYCNMAYLDLKHPTTNQTFEYWEYAFHITPDLGGHFGVAPITGFLLVIVLAMMVLCSLPIIRTSGKFEVFYYTHFLYLAFFLLVLLHGPIFWCFLLLPMTVFILEKSYLFFNWMRSSKTKSFTIAKVGLLPSRVTHLVIKRPKGFKFTAGDYVFVNIPVIAKFEWHPFTISSAPEMQGEMWLHIRSLGNWTTKLRKHFDELAKTTKVTPKEHNGEKKDEHTFMKSGAKYLDTDSVIYVDGPFGTAAHNFYETNHAVLLAAGIGVTPCASILQSVLQRHQTIQSRAQSMTSITSTMSLLTTEVALDVEPEQKLKKVDFIWVNRDLNDFEWFLTLLNHLEMMEAKEENFDRFLDTHLFLTTAKSMKDMKGVALQMALDHIHKKENKDLLTGLKTKMQAGRPNWEKLFKEFKNQGHGKVHIYFCGSNAMADMIKKIATSFGFKFSHSF